MALDEIDHALIQAVLKDAGRSLRELAEEVGVSAPTVASRLERLEDLGLLGPARREADLTQLGTLVLLLVPPGDLEALADHRHVFQVHRTQQNHGVALALVGHPPDDDLANLHQAFPKAETHVLNKRLTSKAPQLPGGPGRVACSQCGKVIEDEGIGLTLGGKRYVVCCPSCKQLLEQRYERHELGR